MITGDGICRRYSLVVSCGVVAVMTFLLFRYSKFTHVTETKNFSFWRVFFAGFTGWCLSTTSSVSGGGSHVGMTTFSFQWNNHQVFFLWNRIYTDTLSATPFYDCTAIKLYSLILCVFYPKHYSYQHPSYLDMCLILSLYLHVLFLSVGFRYHYPWYCFYVYLLIICMYYFDLWVLCIIVYMYIHLFNYRKSGTSDILVLMLFALQCTDYKWNFVTLTLTQRFESV